MDSLRWLIRDELDYALGRIIAAVDKKADEHNHDDEYSPELHDHDRQYSQDGHDHIDEFAERDHEHDSRESVE